MCVLLHNYDFCASVLCVFLAKENEMNAEEFCRKQIAYWLNESRKASENGDFKAFEFAERELANYREMLKTYEQPAT